jgi:serine/threonine protein kinase
MSLSQHPDDQELLGRLLQGKLPLAEVERLAVVYADDKRLAALAETLLGQEDTFAEALRGCRAAIDPAAEQLVERLVERLRHMRTDFGLDATVLVDTPAADGAGGESEAPRPQRLEHFRVLRVLGHGGMGTVYLAEDTRLQRQVAIKTLRPELAANASARERFLREARLAAAIEHDHIVPIFHVGQQDGVPFLAMPLLKGESLDAALQRTKSLDIPQAVRIARQTALALAAAHDRGLIHRDIKPGNIWIEPAECGRVRVLDFGLARAEADDVQLTVSGVILGTPAYMAPEQAGGNTWMPEPICSAWASSCTRCLPADGRSWETPPWASCSI